MAGRLQSRWAIGKEKGHPKMAFFFVAFGAPKEIVNQRANLTTHQRPILTRDLS